MSGMYAVVARLSASLACGLQAFWALGRGELEPHFRRHYHNGCGVELLATVVDRSPRNEQFEPMPCGLRTRRGVQFCQGAYPLAFMHLMGVDWYEEVPGNCKPKVTSYWWPTQIGYVVENAPLAWTDESLALLQRGWWPLPDEGSGIPERPRLVLTAFLRHERQVVEKLSGVQPSTSLKGQSAELVAESSRLVAGWEA